MVMSDKLHNRKQKKILFVNAAVCEGRTQVPVGLIYLASNLKRHGYECEIVHVVGPQTLQVCINKIYANQYLFVGFSIWMGSPALDLLNLAGLAKSRGIPTVAGGKFISSLKSDALEEKNIDIAGIGYCEDTIVEVADALNGEKSLSGINGIIYRDKSGEIITTASRIDDNTDLDRFDYDLSFIRDWTPYLKKTRQGLILRDPLETQRGCLYNCSFCFHSDEMLYRNTKGEKHIASHSIEYVIDKARYLKKNTGVNKISFCDDEFWVDGKRSLIIIEKLKQIGIEIFFIRIRFSSIGRDMVRELKKLNVNSVACGLESGSKRIFGLMNKGQALEMVEKNIKILDEERMRAYTGIIIGNPTETKKEMLESIRYMLSLRKINKSLGLTANVYSVIPSTVFGNLAEREGFKKPDSMRGWLFTGSENYEFLKQWLPWYTEKERKYMIRHLDYFRINSRIAYLLYGKWERKIHIKLLALPLFLLEKITFYRLYYWNFTFPWEVKLYKVFFEKLPGFKNTTI